MAIDHDRLVSDINRFEETFLTAMRNCDLAYMENIFSEDYLFRGSDGLTWGKKKALDDYRNPELELTRVDVMDQKIVVNENTAVITGISHIEGRIGASPLTGKYLFTRVWSKIAAGWKIIAVSTCSADQIP